MKPNKDLLIVLFVTFLFASCQTGNDSTELKTINSKIDSSYSQVADLTMEQFKIYNETFKNDKITAAIQEYSKAKTTVDKDRIIEALKPAEDGRPHGDVNTIKEKGGIDFIPFNTVSGKEDFDLAIRTNNVVASQVKLMNNYFGELNKQTLDAVAFYENLSNEDKAKYFSNQAQLQPVPDYIQRQIGREFQRAYLLQRLQIVELLRRQFLQRRFVNEFPQGFRQNPQTAVLYDDKQFDLKINRKKSL